jgi:hypothetical protein
VSGEWFRSRDLSAEAQEDFEVRLCRAREYNRPQYLAIKAGALLAHGRKAETKMLVVRQQGTESRQSGFSSGGAAAGSSTSNRRVKIPRRQGALSASPSLV